MKQAITTKFLGPTDTKGARVKAFASNARPSVIIPWDHSWSSEKNHSFAAKILKERLGWTGDTVSGVLSPSQVIHVFIS